MGRVLNSGPLRKDEYERMIHEVKFRMWLFEN
jgi:hypothetical protein